MSTFWKTMLSFKEMEYGIQNSSRAETYGSLFFSGISFLFMIVNLMADDIQMASLTAILTFGFLFAALLDYRHYRAPSKILIAFLCGFAFTFYAFISKHDGFAILWVILVPVIGPLFIGLFTGTLINFYFMVLLVVMFYTPLASRWEGIYTHTFIVRFPLLYFVCFAASTILMYQRNQLFAEIQWQAYHDPLTNLYNRRYYNELFEQLENSKNLNHVTVFSIDLNGLKTVNDTLGHEKGDTLLTSAAKLIQTAFSEDSCCRIGGDEFIIISTRKNSVHCIAKLQEAASQWHSLILPKMSMSIGYASGGDYPELSLQELIALADQNMYAEKAAYYKQKGIDRRKTS